MTAFKVLRSARLRWVLLLGIAASFYLSLWPFHYVGATEDDAMYVLNARSLTKGHYGKLNLPGNPPETLALPGYSLFLAPFVYAAGGHWQSLKIITPLLLLLLAFALARWMQPAEPGSVVLGTIALFLFNPTVVVMSDMLFSEPFFLVLFFLALHDLDPAITVSRPAFRPRLAIVLSWLAMTRPEGILLTAAVAGYLARRNDWRRLMLLTTLPFATVALWAVRNYRVSGSVSEYAATLGGWPAGWGPKISTAFSQGIQFLKMVLSTLAPSPLHQPVIQAIWWAAVAFLIAFALWQVYRRHPGRPSLQILLAFMALYLAIHLLSPVSESRYAIILLPFLLGFAVSAVRRNWPSDPLRQVLGCIGMSLIVAIYLTQDLGLALRNRTQPQPYFNRYPTETITWLRAHLPPDARILTNKPHMVALYTQRYTWTAPELTDLASFHGLLVENGIGWVVLRPQNLSYLGRLRIWLTIDHWLRQPRSGFELIFDNANEGVRVYAVQPGLV
jgi:hypothetical protein